MLQQERLKYTGMFVEAWHARYIDVAHLVVFNQRGEEPEGDFFGAVHQETPHNEVHSLHVARRVVILAKGQKDPLERFLTLAHLFLKRLALWKRPADVFLDLDFGLVEVFDPQQIEIQFSVQIVVKFWVYLLKPLKGTRAAVRLGGRLTRTLELVAHQCFLPVDLGGLKFN